VDGNPEAITATRDAANTLWDRYITFLFPRLVCSTPHASTKLTLRCTSRGKTNTSALHYSLRLTALKEACATTVSLSAAGPAPMLRLEGCRRHAADSQGASTSRSPSYLLQ